MDTYSKTYNQVIYDLFDVIIANRYFDKPLPGNMSWEEHGKNITFLFEVLRVF